MKKNNNLKKIGNLNTKTFKKKIIYKHLTELNLVAIFLFLYLLINDYHFYIITKFFIINLILAFDEI